MIAITPKKNIVLRLLVCQVLLLLGLQISCYANSATDSLISVLKTELQKKNTYDRIKISRIHKLNEQLNSKKRLSIFEKYSINEKLLDEYESFQRDSAIVLANRLLEYGKILNNQHKLNIARLKLAKILITSGVFKEASECLDQVDISNESREFKYDYYHLLNWLNWALHTSISDSYYSPNYQKKEWAYRDSARYYANTETYDLELTGAFPDSIYANKNLEYLKYFRMVNEYNLQNPRRAARLSYMYHDLYQTDDRGLNFLLQAAIFDVRNSTKETPAILKVGERLLNKGKIDDAYYLLQEGLDNANFFGSKLHKLEITNLLPQVTAKKILQTERRIMTFVIFTLILSFILLWFIYSRTKLKSLNQKIISKNTELQNILHELEKAQRENSWILKVLAHDLRGTIAGSINVYEIFILNQNLSPEERRMLEMLEESNQDALKTISDLLNIKTGNAALKKTEVDLNKLILESVTLLQYKATEKSQTLKTKVSPITVSVNKEKMRRVLDNILSNAIKFSAPESEILVELVEKEENVVISVADKGIGIPDEYRSKLFELSPQIRREGTFGEESFGLGLYICKQIIDQHKGRIWIETNNGEGTIFFIEFPKS